MKILITGGAGFIGSHAAQFYAEKGDEVVVFDNLSRATLLRKSIKNQDYNWNYLKKFENIKIIKGDIKNFEEIKKASEDCDAIIHAAAQTAVTISIEDPTTDFSNNTIGTFNVLESARKNDVKSVIFTSTNKVYGENVNNLDISEGEKRYSLTDKNKNGIPENFPIDHTKHTPYGCSKLTGDIYSQDFGRLYGIKTGVFRLSCIYGTRQFGVEDQGWVSWITIASLLNKPITIYGDGKQVRDILFVSDLINIFDKFINSSLKHTVLNVGGGPKNTLSLLELIGMLETMTNKKITKKFDEWRPSDQKVYISDISKAGNLLEWEPKINPKDGIKILYNWVSKNLQLFKK